MTARTHRSIDREIAALAVPASLALATEPLYAICDTAILGHIGTAQLAGAALAMRILAFGYAAFVFLMFGTTAAVARHRGADDDRGAVEQGITASWLALVVGCVTAAAFALAGRTFIGWAGGSGATAGYAWTYLWISLTGLPAYTLVMAGVGFHRGLHDSRTPLVVSAGTVALNLVLEIALVYGLGYGVGASALGTVIAKWVGAGLYLALLARRASASVGGAGRPSIRPRRSALRGQLVVGRDLVARTALLLLVITAAQSLAARLGVDSLAAYAIAFELWMFAAYAADGLEAAGQSMVAHRLGAGRASEVAEVARRLLRWAAIGGVSLGIVMAAAAWALPHVFTDDAAVVALAAPAILWVAALQPVNAVAFALDGILVGAGQQRFLAVAMVSAAVAFVGVAWVTTSDERGIAGIWAAMTAFMLVRCGAGLLRLRAVGRPG